MAKRASRVLKLAEEKEKLDAELKALSERIAMAELRSTGANKMRGEQD